MDLKKLGKPFHPARIHWRVGPTNAKKLGVKPWEATKGQALAYLDARDVMNMLDVVCGQAGWSDTYFETQSGRVICTLSIKCGDEWVAKSDAAGDTATEGVKGAMSDAFKRAAVKWGIGRYLYSVEAPWVDLQNGRLPRDFNGSKYLPEPQTEESE